MAGTKIGGLKAKAKHLEKDPNYYSNLGKKGAQAYNSQDPRKRKPRGFAANPLLAREVGAKGGRISKRGPAKNKTQD